MSLVIRDNARIKTLVMSGQLNAKVMNSAVVDVVKVKTDEQVVIKSNLPSSTELWINGVQEEHAPGGPSTTTLMPSNPSVQLEVTKADR